MLAVCVAGTSVVPVAASDVSVFSDGTDASPEAFDSADVDSANVAAQKTIYINFYDEEANAQVKEEPMQVPADATSVNASSLTAPRRRSTSYSRSTSASSLPIRVSTRSFLATTSIRSVPAFSPVCVVTSSTYSRLPARSCPSRSVFSMCMVA